MYSRIAAAPPTPHSASTIADHQRPHRPAARPVDLAGPPRGAPPAGPASSMNASRPARTAIAQRGSSSKCQQTTTPARISRRSIDRIHQRAQAAVLARHARGDPVGVVAPASISRNRTTITAPRPVVAGERDDQEHGDERRAHVADRVGDRPRAQRRAGLGLGRRPGPTGPGRSAAGRSGGASHSSATAAPRTLAAERRPRDRRGRGGPAPRRSRTPASACRP